MPAETPEVQSGKSAVIWGPWQLRVGEPVADACQLLQVEEMQLHLRTRSILLQHAQLESSCGLLGGPDLLAAATTRLPLALAEIQGDFCRLTHLLIRIERAGAHFLALDKYRECLTSEIGLAVASLFEEHHLRHNNFECYYAAPKRVCRERTFGLDRDRAQKACSLFGADLAVGAIPGFHATLGFTPALRAWNESVWEQFTDNLPRCQVIVERQGTAKRRSIDELGAMANIRIYPHTGNGSTIRSEIVKDADRIGDILVEHLGTSLRRLTRRDRTGMVYSCESCSGIVFEIAFDELLTSDGTAIYECRVSYDKSRGPELESQIAADFVELCQSVEAWLGCTINADLFGSSGQSATAGEMVRLALVGPSGSGKSTAAKLLMQALHARGVACEIHKLAKPLYELKSLLYDYAGIEVAKCHQDQRVMHMFATQLREISPRALVDDFFRRAAPDLGGAIINDDLRDVDTDWPELAKAGFRLVRIYATPQLRAERLADRNDITTLPESVLDQHITEIEPDFVLTNQGTLDDLIMQVDVLADHLLCLSPAQCTKLSSG